jgi:hypothetical protein
MSESEYSAQRSTKNTKTSKQQKCKGKRIQTRNQIYSTQNHKRRERTKANCAQVSREFQQRTFLNNDYLIRSSKNWRWVENSKTPPPSLSWGVPSLMHLCCFVKHTSIYFILFCKATLKDGLPPLPLRLHNPLFKHTFILSACAVSTFHTRLLCNWNFVLISILYLIVGWLDESPSLFSVMT